MLLIHICNYLKSFLRYKLLILDTCIYINNDVKIRGCFSKPKGVHKQESLGNTSVLYRYEIYHLRDN